MRKQPLALLLTLILTFSSAKAADTVRWDDIPKKIRTGSISEYTIITKDGHSRKGQALDFSPKGIRLDNSGPLIAREEVAMIRIHHHQKMDDAADAPFQRVFRRMDESWLIFAWALLPAFIGIYTATAPPAVAVEGIRRLLPNRVIKVAP
jgi:hypothetical protein